MEEFIVFSLVILSGLFSGLTLSLTSLPREELERLSALGNPKAQKVLAVTRDQNRLLVSLILGNTVTNSFLTDFMGGVVGAGPVAVAISTFLIFIFGEILPAAVLTRHALSFGSKIAPAVQGLLFITYPFAKPISWLLDKTLGEVLKSIYTRDDFEYMLDKHTAEDSDIDELDNTLIKGTLNLTNIVAGSIATKRRNVYSLKYDTLITEELIEEIKEKRFSRIPVTNDNQVIGILKTKNLLNYKFNEEEPEEVMEYTDSDLLLKFEDSENVDDILETMLEARIHMAAINNSKNMWKGILTMEDILNKLFGTNISEGDEEDFDEYEEELAQEAS